MTYIAFVHWADSQRLEIPDKPIHDEAWLSMKTPSVGSGVPPGAPLATSGILGGSLGDLGNSNMCNIHAMTSLSSPIFFPPVLNLLAHQLPVESCLRWVAQAITIFGRSSPLATSLPAGRLWHSQSAQSLLSKKRTRPPPSPLGSLR